MLSNSLNNFQSKNTLSFQTYKYNNKYPQNIKYNTRYSNTQNKISASNNSNNYNNQFLYKSENKKGFNKMSLASNSQNNDLVLINPKTYTSITKGKISVNKSSLNWNNVGFKEVKWKNKFSNKPNYNHYYSKNNINNLFHSYNINNNYGATAKNLGFYNINTNTNNKVNNNKNVLYSKKNGLVSSYISTLNSGYNNNMKNNTQKNSLYEYYKNIIQIQNAREGLNSKIIKNRMTDEQNIKKINKIQAVWKGIYVRELMNYYWNFNTFQEKLEKILDNYYKRYFLNKLKKNVINEKKFVNDEVVEKYNNLFEQFNEYKKNKEKNKTNNEFITEKINFEILNTVETINSEEIFSNRNEDKEKEKENIKLRSINKNINNTFLQNLNKNLNIVEIDKFCFKKIKNKNNDVYRINNEFFSLINKISEFKATYEENKETEIIRTLIIENQKGFNYEKQNAFNKDDLSIVKKNELNIINNKKDKKEEENKQKILLISNKSDFIIKSKEKEKCDKMTEITEEMNIIKSDTDKNILEKENNSIEYRKEIKEKKIEINNYNSVNEIEKGEALEINPYEIKRTKINKKEISKQNDINVIVSKDNIFKEKSKNNLMKIILPIRLKETLIKYIKKNFFLYLINQLKKISFIYILIQIKENKDKKLKKKGLEKIKERMLLVKLRKYFENEMMKYKIQNMIKKYLYLRWNKGLIDLSNIIINNKNNKSLSKY